MLPPAHRVFLSAGAWAVIVSCCFSSQPICYQCVLLSKLWRWVMRSLQHLWSLSYGDCLSSGCFLTADALHKPRQGAAVHDRLASGTYQRLNAGLCLLLSIAVAASWSVLSVQTLPVRLAWYECFLPVY